MHLVKSPSVSPFRDVTHWLFSVGRHMKLDEMIQWLGMSFVLMSKDFLIWWISMNGQVMGRFINCKRARDCEGAETRFEHCQI